MHWIELAAVWLTAAVSVSCFKANHCVVMEVDRAFTREQAADVRAAMAAWHTATGVCIYEGPSRMKIKRATELYDVARIDREADAVGVPYAIGWTDKRWRAWILTDRTDRTFSVAAHEIGHLLGLGHYQGNRASLMVPMIQDAPLAHEIPRRDAVALCEVWACTK